MPELKLLMVLFVRIYCETSAPKRQILDVNNLQISDLHTASKVTKPQINKIFR